MELTATKYKETEIGLIPEDWDLVSFDKVFTFHSASNYSKAQMSDDGEVGCIHYGLIHAIPSTQYNLKNGIKYYVSSDQAKYDIVRDGDVIMVDASEDEEGVNKSVEVCGIGNKKYISGLHTYLLRDKNGSLADNFRGILLNSQLVKSQMLQLAVGMKVFGVSKTQLIKVKLPLPPTLTEQKTIAQVLSDMDALIQVLEKKIVKKKLIKKGVMQKLLTPKKGWSLKKLGNLCETITTGKLDANAMVKDGAFRFYTCAKEYYYIDNYSFDTEALLVSGNGANVGYIHYYKGRFNAYQRTYVLSGFKQNILFIKQFMDKYLKIRIDEQKNDGNTPYIKMDTLTEMEIHYPQIEEQKQIVHILSDVDKEIVQLEEKLSKYQLAKQGMMQQLLTGKIRLV